MRVLWCDFCFNSLDTDNFELGTFEIGTGFLYSIHPTFNSEQGQIIPLWQQAVAQVSGK